MTYGWCHVSILSFEEEHPLFSTRVQETGSFIYMLFSCSLVKHILLVSYSGGPNARTHACLGALRW